MDLITIIEKLKSAAEADGNIHNPTIGEFNADDYAMFKALGDYARSELNEEEMAAWVNFLQNYYQSQFADTITIDDSIKIGTEKQISWAKKIFLTKKEQINKYLSGIKKSKKDDAVVKFTSFLSNERADFYINNKDIYPYLILKSA